MVFTRQLYNMLQLSRVIVQGAAMRDESRGAHYKPDFPERDDDNWLKTTKATFSPDTDAPRFEFEPVDTSLIPPAGPGSTEVGTDEHRIRVRLRVPTPCNGPMHRALAPAHFVHSNPRR